ncbi:MAG: TIGR03905 family TSCPD domain-containing protein [Oscillospiraceae bacterium]|jgi:uncharacterized protein (TIGR03905 family)|nr:TIGR03905 family TSCPD domain-containing protein [Oscillospiraceae bacterium]
MKLSYVPHGVCPTKIQIDTEGDVINDVAFEGGCNGNLKAVSILVKGMRVEDAISKLEGIKCGRKSTSCADQLAFALKTMTPDDDSEPGIAA